MWYIPPGGSKTKLIPVLMLVLFAIMIADGSDMPKKVVPASEILDKLQNGEPVLYDRAFIDGNLDIGSIFDERETIDMQSLHLYI